MRQTTPAEEQSFGTEHGATQLCPLGDGDGAVGAAGAIGGHGACCSSPTGAA